MRALALALLLGTWAAAAAAARYDDAWADTTQAAAEAAAARLAPAARALVPTVRRVPGLTLGTAAGGRALTATVTDLQQAVKQLGARETELEVRIELPGDVLFDVDQARIRPDAARALAQVAVVIRAYTGAVQLLGHTDSDGSEAHNLALSQRRADAVAQWLVQHEGVPAARLVSTGRGETEPRAANDTADNKQSNRRVEVVVSKR